MSSRISCFIPSSLISLFPVWALIPLPCSESSKPPAQRLLITVFPCKAAPSVFTFKSGAVPRFRTRRYKMWTLGPSTHTANVCKLLPYLFGTGNDYMHLPPGCALSEGTCVNRKGASETAGRPKKITPDSRFSGKRVSIILRCTRQVGPRRTSERRIAAISKVRYN